MVEGRQQQLLRELNNSAKKIENVLKLGSLEPHDVEAANRKIAGIVETLLAAETEIEDKKLRYEDSINALKGAIVEGMVPGGGACYAYMLRYEDEARALFGPGYEDEAAAVDVILEAMREPVRQIASNAGVFGEMVLEKVRGTRLPVDVKGLTMENLYHFRMLISYGWVLPFSSLMYNAIRGMNYYVDMFTYSHGLSTHFATNYSQASPFAPFDVPHCCSCKWRCSNS